MRFGPHRRPRLAEFVHAFRALAVRAAPEAQPQAVAPAQPQYQQRQQEASVKQQVAPLAQRQQEASVKQQVAPLAQHVGRSAFNVDSVASQTP